MLTFKKHMMPAPLEGVPAFRVFAGAACLGTIVNVGARRDIAGPGGMSWQGTSEDGTRFAGTSRPKIVQKLQIHAAAKRAQAAAERSALIERILALYGDSPVEPRTGFRHLFASVGDVGLYLVEGGNMGRAEFRQMIAESQRAGLALDFRVYGRTCTYAGPNVHFEQIGNH